MAPSQFAHKLPTQHPHQRPNMRPYHPEDRGELPRTPGRLRHQTAAGRVDAERQETESRVINPPVTSSDAAKVFEDTANDKSAAQMESSGHSILGKIPQTDVQKQRRNLAKPQLNALKQPTPATTMPDIPTGSSPPTPKLVRPAGNRFLESPSPPKRKFSHIPEYLQPDSPHFRRPADETRRITDKHALLTKYGHLTQKNFPIPANKEIRDGRSFIKNLHIDKQTVHEPGHDAGLNHNLNNGQDYVKAEALNDRKMLSLGLIIIAIVVLILVKVTGAEPVVRKWCGSMKLRMNRAGWKGDFKMGLRNTYWARRTRKTRSANVRASGGFELASKHDMQSPFWADKGLEQHGHRVESGCGVLGA